MDFTYYEDQLNYIGTSCGTYLIQLEHYNQAKNSNENGQNVISNHEADKDAALSACLSLENLCYDMTYTKRSL